MRTNADSDTLLGEINRRLDPDSIAIDDRDMRDRLAFAAAIADLVVFYDARNQAAGNWRALMLKDPTILLAVISKTPYQPLHFRFSQLQRPLSQYKLSLLNRQAGSKDAPDNRAEAVHQLLLLLDTMFDHINTWGLYLSQSATAYPLRQFVLEAIPQSLSDCLWQRISAQRYLLEARPGWALPMPDTSQFGELWRNRGPQIARPASMLAALSLLETIYHQVFSFFMQVITSAKDAFYALCDQQNDFPDTALVIAFNRLLQFSQSGLNSFSRRHLDFYYRTLLQQQPCPAEPDQTFLCLTLVAGQAPVTLAAGTTFLADADAEQRPITFVSTQDTEINGIRLGAVINSDYAPDESGNKQLYVDTLPDSTQVRRDAQQHILASDWFGGNGVQARTQGLAFASPLFCLSAGERVLTLTLTLDQPVDVTAYQQTAVALSSAKQWLDVTGYCRWQQGDTLTQISVTVTLDAAFPAVAAFTVAPSSAFDTAWPYCRLSLPPTVDLQHPPRWLALQIATDVKHSPAVTLLNDGAPLPAGKPMAVFGPTPSLGSGCCLSAPEVFSQPLTQLSLQFFWDHPPTDLSQYYAAYNQWLAKHGGSDATFSNAAFQVDWQADTPTGWQTQPAILTIAPPADDVPSPPPAPQRRSWLQQVWQRWWQGVWQRLWHPTRHVADDAVQATGGLLAQTQSGKINANAPTSSFSFRFPPGMAWRTPADDSTAAIAPPHLRMTLIAPSPAFGFGMYPQLVADISLQNAKALMSFWGKGDTTAMPNPPWVPKVTQVLASYRARQTLDFSQPQALSQAFALVHLGTLASYCYFSQSAGTTTPQVNLAGVALQPDAATSAPGLALYQGVCQAACAVFIPLTAVSLPCRLSLFIELAQEVETVSSPASIPMYYWSQTGWKPLGVLSDQTGGLSASGVIALDLPQDMALDSPVLATEADAPGAMPQRGWLLMTQAAPRRVRVVYCNTQGMRVERQTLATLPAGVQPQLAAGSITALAAVNPAIAAIVQPFDSTGGRPAEDDTLFRQRVSQRLKTKDRINTRWDGALLARQAYPGLFFVKNLSATRPGEVRFGVVQAYRDASTAGAFRPAVPREGLNQILAYLSARQSAMAQVSVCNLRPELVQVVATLVIATTANANDLAQALTQSINLFLSPWIRADQPQYPIATGVSSAAVASVLTRFDEVAAIQQLQLRKLTSDHPETAAPATVPAGVTSQDTLLQPTNEDQLLVSALNHQLTFIRTGSTALSAASVTDTAAVMMPQNTLAEVSA
ncbi:baseplate J/gp47 family protein [Dickeya dadantii]|uniref:baseplate J/gp47 family protein n=1 Tax=Dickeya dadantii TaxID=204038 RepID=UPI001C0B5A06|nr:baseplate J/gp47 family protein [Dickeya dadantii]QWT40684.1 baseplate J/gp47 family protein [Dickeya dadantii]